MGSGIFYPVVSGDDSFSGGGSVGVGYNYLRFGDAAGTVFGLWIRFPDITIPQGSTITEAYVRFVSYTDRNTVTCNVSAYFNNVDDAVAPTSSAQFDGLALTDGIAWDSVEAWINGSQYNTPELKTILQTIVNRANWISGNAAQFIIKDNGSSSDAQRFPSSIDYLSGTEKAELHVTWFGAITAEPFSLTATLSANPAIPFETQPFELTSSLSIPDIYSGVFVESEPLQLTSSLSANLSAQIVSLPFELIAELSANLSTQIVAQALELVSTLSARPIIILRDDMKYYLDIENLPIVTDALRLLQRILKDTDGKTISDFAFDRTHGIDQ